MTNQVLENAAIRSFVLLAVTALAVFICRRSSASVLHRMWTLGLMGCLLIPLVTLISPGWELSVLPTMAMQGSSTNTVQVSTQASAKPIQLPTQSIMDDRGAKLSNPKSVSDLQQQPAVDSLANTTSTSAETSLPSFSKLAFWVWLSVAFALAVRLVVQWYFVQRMLPDCAPIEAANWETTKLEVCEMLDVKQDVSLRLHPQAISPMVTGILRSVVVLPQDAERWTTERRQMVLLHELAHVKRNDVLTHAIAGIACVLNWFNPMSWYGLKQMRMLREIACDDLVVTHCCQPAEYAGTLLDVARAYRHKDFALTVAMARTSNVEGRILAILDSARNRANLSRCSAVMLFALFLCAVSVAGAMQLTTIAETQTVAQADASGDETPIEARNLRVRVLDQEGMPLTDANVLTSIWEIETTGNFPTKTYATDDKGEVDVVIPEKLRILRIWPSKASFVPLFVNFSEGTHEEGRLIPDTYEFRLRRGARLSGTIMDEDGNPIANAKVQVSVAVNEPAWGTNPEPMISTWLAEGNDAALTNESGRWEILNAPHKRADRDYEFRLQVTHPNFAGDTRRGELQEQQGVTTAQLRAGTAKVVMDRGLKIAGTIKGPNGKLVTKGLVIWDDRPYWADGVNETQIDASGKYATLQLSPGEYPVTVLAPGYAPKQEKIKLDNSSTEFDFELESGERIELQIVDSYGYPVPGAYVGIGEWRGTEAIYNEKHPNVPESGIPRHANDNGVYVWEWAPEDAVQYRIGKKGFVTTEVTLVAGNEPHRVELSPMMRIFGTVTDATTGKPIEQFSVVPVKAFRPEFYSTSFRDRVEGKDGEYQILVDSQGQTGNRYMVRVEADGYRTAFATKSMVVGDQPLHEDFALERSPALSGEVVGPDGTPAKDFTVAVGTATFAPQFSIERPDSNYGIAFTAKDGSTFELPATFEPQRIRVFNGSGFAEVYRLPDEPLGTIQLEPWGTVSGRLMQGDQSIPNEWVYFRPLVRRGLTEARFQDSFATRTDPDGNFRFDRLPPMAGHIQAYLGPWQPSPMTSSRSAPVNLKPGEDVTVVLGGGGNRIVGDVVAKGRDNDSLSKNWSLNYLISRKPSITLPADANPLGIAPNQSVDPAMLRHDDFQSWVASKEHYFAKLSDDGQLQVDGVSPGEYDLVIQLYEQPAGCLIETIGEKVIPVTVLAGEKKQEPLDLGEIEVECRSGPRVGSDMRAFKFIDATGREQVVDELEGQFVLFHVWASWCAPCLQTMPEVKATIENAAEAPLTVVGLNVDADATKAKTLASEGGWEWAQNYLGSESDLMRQLAVSSVPAYYLIGPDGKLQRSSNQWEEIRKHLENELRP